MDVPVNGADRDRASAADGNESDAAAGLTGFERSSLRTRERRFARGIRAVLLGVATNALLIVLKATVGILGHSQALVADAVHSAADLVNSLLAFGSLLISRRPADVTHPYGHGRAEALSANIAAMIIGSAGVLVIWGALTSLMRGHSETPELMTLWVAAIALVTKAALAVYATRVARSIKSKAVNADARDHVADVMSSGVVIVGIIAARLGAPLLDPLAGLVVGGFILYTAWEVFLSAAHELMETSLPPAIRSAVIAEAGSVPGIQITGIAGRTLGDMMLVEIHAEVDPVMTVGEAGRVIDEVKSRLIGCVADITHVVVELNSGAFEPETLRVGGVTD